MTMVYLPVNEATTLATRDCGLPIPGGDQGQAGWVSQHPGLVEGAPTHSRGDGTR